MPKKIDLTNKKFQNLYVLREATKQQKNFKKGAWWVCKCDCGNIVIKDGQGLRKGYTTSCGCKTVEKLKNRPKKPFIDETGNRYGRLLVLQRDYDYEKQYKSHSTCWKCQCDCGNIKTICRDSLIRGKTQSCGCLQKEEAAKTLSDISKNSFIDEVGNKYGKLLVLKKIENTTNRIGIKWLCQCECGNFKQVMGIDLRNGTVSSCGCLGKSKGQYLIEILLKENNLNYSKEYSKIINNKNLRFDFAILNNNQQLKYLIEFDGIQHFKPVKYFGGQNYYNYIHNHDLLKNNWCQQNNIPLIRIPYTKIDNLTIDDLKLETTTFLV